MHLMWFYRLYVNACVQVGGLTREAIERMEKERQDEELALSVHVQENSYSPRHASGRDRDEQHVPASYDLPPTSSASALDQGNKRRPVIPDVQVHGRGADFNGEDSGGMGTEDSGGMSTEDRDAKMAQMLYNEDLEYVKNNPGIKNSGRGDWVDLDDMGGWHRDHDTRRSPVNKATGGIRGGGDRPKSPGEANGRDMSWRTENDARLAQQLYQREKGYVEKLRIDSELAKQMQQAENQSERMEAKYEASEASRGGTMVGEERRHYEVTEEDRRFGERMQSYSKKPQRGEEDLGVACRLLGENGNSSKYSSRTSQETYGSNREVLMNEEPRPKNPVQQEEVAGEEEEKVPCQYCSELFPFSLIMDHQVSLWWFHLGIVEILYYLLLLLFSCLFRTYVQQVCRQAMLNLLQVYTRVSGSPR